MLSKRLEQVASMVTKGNIIADIGTDHGYVPIYLVEKGICPKAYAMDINQGPIESAIKNIENYGLSEKIQAIKSNGLEKLEPEKADTIIIAGMGGELIVNILENGLAKLENCSRPVKELVDRQDATLKKYLDKENAKFQKIKQKMIENQSKDLLEVEKILEYNRVGRESYD